MIALGSDMLEKPENSSKQKSICFSLNTKISNGSNIEVKDKDGNVVKSFEAKEDFKTLIISNEKVNNETYYLYVNGKKI